jgi:hypothetical protein
MSRLGPVSSSAGRKPGTPTIGTASAGNAQATVTFTEPSYLGKPNSSLTYTATSSPSSISNTGSASPITVTGLSNGTSYTFAVKLNNTVLDSDFSSASNSVTPVAPPFFPPFFPPSFPFFPPYFPAFSGFVPGEGPFFPPYFPQFTPGGFV